MLVYDITNEKSFDNIKNWIRNIEEVISIHLYNLQKLASEHSEFITDLLFVACFIRCGKDDPRKQM